jgi:Ca2+-binding EF-hand superfamily protein
MKSTLYRVVLSGTLLIATLLLPATTTAQDQMRFRAMDRNRDGVVTRAEWQGNDQSFRQQDRNGDGILSGDEVRVAQGAGMVNAFASVDLDGNGKVTAQEWRRAFTQLDVNRDGVLTDDELWSRNAPKALTPAFQAGRDRGLNDGRQAGREDREGPGVWDLEGQRELGETDAGYRSELGPRDQYQAGYLEGFRQGYAEGYGPRR